MSIEEWRVDLLEDKDDGSPDDEPPAGKRLKVALDGKYVGLEQVLDLETTSESKVHADHQGHLGGNSKGGTHNPIPAQLMSWAEPTKEIHQSRNLAAVDEMDKYDRHPTMSTKRTETHGTPCLLTRPRILGA